MKKVTSCDSLITVNHYKNLLESEGIPAFLKNEYMGSIMGEVPFQEIWPELWVKNDLDLDRARQLIDSARIHEESPTTPWLCSKCKVENEGQFSACWQCGAEHCG